MAGIRHIQGNTYCIVTEFVHIPFYRLNKTDVVLLDSGFFFQGEEIQRTLDDQGYVVRALVTSHVHYDHVGNHLRFQEMGAKVYQCELDAGLSSSLVSLSGVFYTDSPKQVNEIYPYMLFDTDVRFRPMDRVVNIEGAEFKILDIPGHAHGQLGFITPDNVAYLGDALFSESMLKDGSLLFHHNWGAALDSLEVIQSLDCDYYVLAHGEIRDEIRGLTEKNSRFFQKTAEDILNLLDQPYSKEEYTLRIMNHYGVSVKTPNKYHIADRICNSIIFYLEDTERITPFIEERRLIYRKQE